LALQGSDSPPIVVLLGLSSPLPRIVGSLSEVQNLPREDMPPQILLREDPALTQGLPLPPPAILQSDGSFEFPMVVPGQYVLCVKGGAASCAISPTFRVSAGENVRVDMVIPAVSASPGGK
jgi:hypothetical protein